MKHVCLRCEQEFNIGDKAVCPRAPDRGEHETRLAHIFKAGRLDGLCAEPMPSGGMCGHDRRTEWNAVHVG